MGIEKNRKSSRSGHYTKGLWTAVGVIVRQELKSRGWTIKSLADKMGRPVQTLSRIVWGHTGITPKTATELSLAFEMPLEFWTTLMNDHKAHLLKVQRRQEPAVVTGRFWSKTEPRENGCIEWTGCRSHGYGRFRCNGRLWGAHRFAYEVTLGPIPEGLVLDHLCRNTACVNPSHLEPVTDQINFLRGIAPTAIAVRLNRCFNGHEFTVENTKTTATGLRRCRICAKVANRRSQLLRTERRRNLRAVIQAQRKEAGT